MQLQFFNATQERNKEKKPKILRELLTISCLDPSAGDRVTRNETGRAEDELVARGLLHYNRK